MGSLNRCYERTTVLYGVFYNYDNNMQDQVLLKDKLPVHR